MDLSWSINVEADLAGYRVYRSEQQGNAGIVDQSQNWWRRRRIETIQWKSGKKLLVQREGGGSRGK